MLHLHSHHINLYVNICVHPSLFVIWCDALMHVYILYSLSLSLSIAISESYTHTHTHIYIINIYTYIYTVYTDTYIISYNYTSCVFLVLILHESMHRHIAPWWCSRRWWSPGLQCWSGRSKCSPYGPGWRIKDPIFGGSKTQTLGIWWSFFSKHVDLMDLRIKDWKAQTQNGFW